jgi:hypothetical protein
LLLVGEGEEEYGKVVGKKLRSGGGMWRLFMVCRGKREWGFGKVI